MKLKYFKFNDLKLKILMLFFISLTRVFVNSAYSKPPKITYIREHSPRKGDYRVVTVNTVVNGDWSQTTVSCKGYDNVKCCAYSVFNQRENDLLTEFSASEINYIENSILPAIDDRILQDNLFGRTTFSTIVAGGAGVITSFLVEWNCSTIGEINISINRIEH